MKIKIYENGVLKEEFLEEGFVCGVRSNNINAFNIGEGEFSPCQIREFSVDGEKIIIRTTTSPDLSEFMEIMKRFSGMKMLEAEFEGSSAKVEIEM